jgi:hypothetical protein
VVDLTNKHDEQFALLGEGQKLPSSTELSSGSGYPNLFNYVGYTCLTQLGINKRVAVWHLVTLANYQVGSGQARNLKISLAFFALVVSEAERFGHIPDTVAEAWDNPNAQKIPRPVIDLVVNWARISCTLRAWVRYDQT